MNIFEKFRIKRKIRKVCRVLYHLPQMDQEECMNRIIYCLRITDDWHKKERFLDLLLERWDAVCQ